MTSTTPSGNELILKVDTIGRVRTPREQREAILDEFERCGMSGAAFAEQYGIKYSTFASWRHARQRKARKQAAESNDIDLAEVVVIAGTDSAAKHSQAGACIELPGGARMRVSNRSDAAMAAAVLRALQETGSC